MSKWMPMETAPKDGTDILAYGPGVKGFPGAWDTDVPREACMAIIHWREAWYEDYEEQPDGLFKKVSRLGYAYWAPHPHQLSPTHWMPLPDSP
jgi:hypothetical protein